MNKIFGTGVLAISSLMVSAAPAYATTIFSLQNTQNGGTVTTTGGTVTALTGVPLNQLVYNGTTYTLTGANDTGSATESLSGNTLTILGQIYNAGTALTNLGGSSVSTVYSLFTITFAGALSNINGATSTSLNAPFVGTGSPGITSASTNAQLLTDLGLTGYLTNVIGGGVIGSGSVNGSNGTYGSTSNTLSLQLTPAPEPGSMFLMGAGLIAGVLVRRRKSSVPQ